MKLSKEAIESRRAGGASKKRQQNSLEKSYNRALGVLESKNLEPLFTKEDWKGCTDKNLARYYKVKCKLCGQEYETWFSGNNCSKCPGCSKGAVNSIKTRYIRICKHCKDNNVEPLFKESEYKGTMEGKRFVVFPVRCLTCGNEYKTTFLGDNITKCPVCYPSKSVNNRYAYICRLLEQNNKEPLFTESQYLGTERSDRSKIKYPIRCKVCGTCYESIVTGPWVYNCPKCTDGNRRSKKEISIVSWLESKGIEVWCNCSSLGLISDKGRPFDIDIYLPKYKIGFELNGYYWHNSGPDGKDKNYHKMKTDKALEKGIKLYHLWEKTPEGLCKSIINSKIGLNRRVYARNLSIKEVDRDLAKEFLDRNHVDGFVQSSKYYALVDSEGDIQCMITLMRRAIQASKQAYWEIGRFASKRGVTVVGGYSRLLKHSIIYLKLIGVKTLVSYCNRDLSPDYKDTFYYKQGFEYVGDSGMIYSYWVSKSITINGVLYKEGSLIGRHSLQKSKLLEIYKERGLVLSKDENTEYSLATGLGLFPVYNSGNFKYRLDL